MQFQLVFLCWFLSTAVIAKDRGSNSTKEVTNESICRNMRKLTRIVETAANATKLAEQVNNPQQRPRTSSKKHY